MPVGSVRGPGKEVRFAWTIVERDTMTYSTTCMWLGQHCESNWRVYERNDTKGVLFYRNSSQNTGDAGVEMTVPDAAIPSVLLADGYCRTVTTVNGMLPGPTIDVVEGDTVVVDVFNALVNEPTSMHWHGLYQRGTPWMDGVSMVTQCPILPGESFTYRFVAEPAGTHFWHAHHGVQRPEGLSGALVVRPKTPAPAPAPAPAPVVDCSGGHFIVHLSMWLHESTASVFRMVRRPPRRLRCLALARRAP